MRHCRLDAQYFSNISISSCLLILAASCLWAANENDNPSPPEYAIDGISEARIDFLDGMPRLLINNDPVLPVVFFFNTAGGCDSGQVNLAPQVELAARNGFHIYSMPFINWPWIGDGDDFSASDHTLDRFIEVDPQAMFILRIWVEPPHNWSGWKDAPQNERILYADGTRSLPSVASEYYWKKFEQSLRRLISRYEYSSYGKKILAYHVGGQNTTEWFHEGYREKGPDYSEVNQRRFRKWLGDKYVSDEALAMAWGDASLKLEEATIPQIAPGSFPIGSVTAKGKEDVLTFFMPPGDGNWIDFSEYNSDIIADRIIASAKTIKEVTQGRKLAVAFYGYTFELCASFSGHDAMHRILRCPEIDVLAAPLSYQPRKGRLAGGMSAAMTAIDSVAAHGKLWINENDTRTHLVAADYEIPSWMPLELYGIDKGTKTPEETLGILERDFALLVVHRVGTWWMDVVAGGAFNSPRLWQMLKERGALYREVYDNPVPYHPDVAVIVDERSILHVKDLWDVRQNVLTNLRNACAESGAAVGYYYLDDFIEGITPPCEAYVFANAFYLVDEQIEAIHARLNRERATAIWQYAPGFLGPSGADIKRCGRITGIHLAVKDGKLGSRGQGDITNHTWGWFAENRVSPRLIVDDQEAEPFGHYVDGGEISAARKRVGDHSTVFVGDFGLNPRLLAHLFEEAGVHIWTRNSVIIHTDGNTLLVHGKRGTIEISIPPGKDVKPVDPEVPIVRNGNRISVNLTSDGQSCWFRILSTLN